MSESDRDKALAETSELVAEMRKKFLANPDTNQHSSIIDRAVRDVKTSQCFQSLTYSRNGRVVLPCMALHRWLQSRRRVKAFCQSRSPVPQSQLHLRQLQQQTPRRRLKASSRRRLWRGLTMITPSLAAARRRRRRNENELVGCVRHGHFLTDSRDKSGSCKGGRGFVTQYRRCECRPGRHSTPPTNSCRGRALQRLEQRLQVSSVFVDYRVEPDFYTR